MSFRALVCLGLLCSACHAQQAALPPTCKPVDLFLTPSFSNSSGMFTLAVDFQNISAHDCNLNGPIDPISFVPDRVEGQPPMPFHWPSRNLSTLILKPGESGNVFFSWQTVPQSPETTCLQLQWLGGQPLVVAPSLLPRACSPIDTRPYIAGSFTTPSAKPTLDITSTKSTYLQGEFFKLQVTRKPGVPYEAGEPAIPAYTLHQESGTLPAFYLLHRSPNGDTRFDAMPARVEPCFGTHGSTTSGPDGTPCLQIDSGANSRWNGVGKHLFRIYEQIGPPTAAPVLFRSSETLELVIQDPASLKRTWAPQVAGLAASIDLDKSTYSAEENIPIHIALENFASDLPIYGWDPVWDSGEAVHVVLLDAHGDPLAQARQYSFGGFTGHGFGPRKEFSKGAFIPIERTYFSFRSDPFGSPDIPPLEPGSYTFAVLWNPLIGENKAVVHIRATANFQIVP